MMSVSIVIPVYNGVKLLKKFLPSVVKATKVRSNNIIEIIVVDDASNDGSSEFIKKNFPEVKIFKHKVNRGFSASVNMGVRMAKGELICLLNQDVSVSENFLKQVIKDFKDKKAFAITLHEKGFGGAAGFFEEGFVTHKPLKEVTKKTHSFWASGGSAVFKREIWMILGGLDEQTYAPFYWEDVDISYRAQKRGYNIFWEPKSLVFHDHESTIGKTKKTYRQRIQERNQLLFIWKNITSIPLARKHFKGLLKRIVRHPGYLIIVFMALTRFIIVFKLRKKESKESKVSDEAIMQMFS